jgi:NADH dehydrogenase [ubiquinone] 1 alpha subcomplex assembly factor 1
MSSVHASDKIFHFNDAQAIGAWFVLNDGVMGGVSQSKIVQTYRGTMGFTGLVSLDNDGGFASIQAQFAPLDLTTYEGIELRVRGDGKRYGLNLRDSFGAIVHQAEFMAKDWRTVQIPFKSLQPNWFGYPMKGAPPLNTSRIVSMSFIIEKQVGRFVLEIESVGVYRRKC